MDIITPNIPKILFIKGVFKKDCIQDDIFEKKILENIDIGSKPIIEDEMVMIPNEQYHKIPNTFTNLKSWVDKTNLLCWNCNLSFNSIPIFIPNVIEPDLSKNGERSLSLGVYGVFCNFNCAYQFILNNNIDIIQQTEYINNLDYLQIGRAHV